MLLILFIVLAVYIYIYIYIYIYVMPNSKEITYIIETGFTYVRNMLAKVEVTVKDNT